MRLASLQKISVSTRDEDGEKINGVELNMVTLMIGYNGSGKTFYLVSCYVISEIANIVHNIGSSEKARDLIIGAAQFIVDSCYIKKLTGRVEGYFDTGAHLYIDMEDGQVTAIKGEGWEEVDQVRSVRYMSTAMRTFESIGQYLFSRKLLNEKTREERFIEMCKNWKIFDVQHVERLIEMMPLTFDDQFREVFKKFDINDEIMSFDVDLEKCDFFYKTSDGKSTYMRTLGSGHQSIFNMMIGSM